MAQPLNALELLQNYQNNNSLLAARSQQMDATAQTAPLQRQALQQNMLAKSVDMQRQQQQLNALKDYATTGNVNALAAGNPQAAMQINSMNQRRDYQNAMLGLRDKALSNARVPPGYKANPDGTLAPIPGGPAAPNGPAGASSNLSGDEFLKSLPPQSASQIKALAEGRMAFPGAMALKTPYWQQMLGNVSQYDPDFDASNYNKRSQTAAAFSKGKQGDALRAINQATNHAVSLSGTIDKLDNSDATGANLVTPAVNAIKRTILNDPTQGEFTQNATALASELRKVFSGSGGGNLTELQKWEESLPLNESKSQQKAYLSKGIDLLQGGIESLNGQYRAGMGPKADIMQNDSLIYPGTRAKLEQLRGGGTTAPNGGDFKVIRVEKK